jgi:hypothetical protein
LILDADRAEIHGTLSDASEGGAAIMAGPCSAGVGQQGELVLNRITGARTRIAIRAIAPDGRLHVQFEYATMPEAFKTAIAALISELRTTAGAAAA